MIRGINDFLRLGTHTATDHNGVDHVVCRSHHPDLGAGHRLHPHHLTAAAHTTDSSR